MKLTESKLKEIIKEEHEKLNEIIPKLRLKSGMKELGEIYGKLEDIVPPTNISDGERKKFNTAIKNAQKSVSEVSRIIRGVKSY